MNLPIPKSILFGLIKTKLKKKAGFDVIKSEFDIDYEKGSVTGTLYGEKTKKTSTKTIDAADEDGMSDGLINGITKRMKQEKMNCDKIDRIKMVIDIKERCTYAEVYYQDGKDFKHINLKDVI